MHKILIVDDDRIIRKGLLTTIPWEANGFRLVGEAGDGEQALELIEAQRPQIVVTDIRMPFMDGLQLAEEAKKRYPDLKFIFLTGYEDFNYAKQALKIGAVDYLLKPVEREVLLEKVRKAAAEWDAEQGQQQKINEALPFLRQVFFRKLLAGEGSSEALLSEADFLGLRLHGVFYAVMLLKLDDYFDDAVHASNTRGALKFSVGKSAEEILYLAGAGGVFNLEEDAQAIVYTGTASKDRIAQQARGVAQKLCETVRENFHATLTIGIGTPWQGLGGIASSFDEAHDVMEFRHVIGKDKVISVTDLDGIVNEVQDVSKDVSEAALIDKVRLGLVGDALQAVAEIESSLQASRLPLSQVRLMAVDLLLELFKGASVWAQEWSRIHREKKAFYYDKINRMQTIAEIMDLLRSLVDSLGQFMTDENASQRGEVIDEVTAYIEEHFAEHGLSLQDIGEYVHMNPIYLSVLFKKKKNITFTGFLLQVRMKKAMEMLRCQDLKTYEVAERTGYSSPEYFGSCFKKYTGLSPVEFRNKG